MYLSAKTRRLLFAIQHPVQYGVLCAQLRIAERASDLAYNEWAINAKVHRIESDRWIQFIKEFNMTPEDSDKWYNDHVKFGFEAREAKMLVWHNANQHLEAVQAALDNKQISRYPDPFAKEEEK